MSNSKGKWNAKKWFQIAFYRMKNKILNHIITYNYWFFYVLYNNLPICNIYSKNFRTILSYIKILWLKDNKIGPEIIIILKIGGKPSQKLIISYKNSKFLNDEIKFPNGQF